MDDVQEKESQPIKKDKEKLQLSGSPETPVSVDGKLLVKLKIPKVEGGVRDEEINKVQGRVCEVCQKSFSSGKALGGHMRVHVQNKEVSPKKLIKTSHPKQRKQIIHVSDCNDTTANARADGHSKPTCSLCCKNFPSMKSLFGHMRCHPEREWRGIQPPPVAKNSPASSVSNAAPAKIDDQIDSDAATSAIPMVVDLTGSLKGWSVTARRGRKSFTANSAHSSSEEEEERLHDAVQYLMKLAEGNSLESGLTHKHIHAECEATNSNSLNNKAEIEDEYQVSETKQQPRIEASQVGYKSDYPVKKLKIDERGFSTDAGKSCVISKFMDKIRGKAVLETGYFYSDWHVEDDDYKNCIDHEESESKNTDGSVRNEQLTNYKYESTGVRTMVIKNKKKRKKLKLKDLESVHNDNDNAVDHQIQIQKGVPSQYKCSTCNKCFSTHQALGGHRSSHNKARNFHNTIDESSSAAAAEDENHAYPITRVDETKESEGAASSKLAEISSHQCKICKKTFPTGQALGGHKRCHWTAPVEAPSSQVTSPGQASQTPCRRVLDFDLNEPAAMEFEEGFEHEAGSFNSVA